MDQWINGSMDPWIKRWMNSTHNRHHSIQSTSRTQLSQSIQIPLQCPTNNSQYFKVFELIIQILHLTGRHILELVKQ